MSAKSVAYTHSVPDTNNPDKEDAKIVTVLEPGFINDETINKFSYSFTPPSDITDSLEKGKKKQKTVSTRDGRVVYSSMSCTYPDKTVSDTVVIEGVIFQYREKVSNDSTYGKQYICAGIKDTYIAKFMSDAMSNAPSVHVKPGPKVKHQDGYYWFDAKLDRLSDDDTTIVFINPETNEDMVLTESLINMVNNNKSNMIGQARCIISGSITNNDKSRMIQIEGADLTMGVKLTEVFIKDTTNIKGPTLGPLKGSNTEKTEVTERVMASSAMAAYAMSRLNIK
ncbi:hypothetical protein MAN_10849, partial [Metarhizium hybridum]